MTVAVFPQPKSVVPENGQFAINAQTHLEASPGAEQVAEYLAKFLRASTGFAIPVDRPSTGGANTIALSLAGENTALGKEGYTLQVNNQQVKIQAAQPQGLFYGVQTLRQLLPPEIEAGKRANASWTIPAVQIEDAPRFPWRGLMLDVGRHFFPVSYVKKFLDVMAFYKFNVFHWHLTEDQGWRIEIKKYPRLTQVGSQRSASPVLGNRKELDGKPSGGFYTQEQIKEVVAYAEKLFITVLPEIEMPGHSVAALASYPELGCVGKDYQVRTFWGIADDVLCAGKEDAFTFVEHVLSEVLDLFPSKYIHIGGDECPKVRWESCPHCQERIKREGLKDEHELQSYFIRRVEKFLEGKGRHLIGWDEILEGGLAPNATVMSWRGTQGGIDAATAGHDVVMSPTTSVYFDYYQSQDTANEPPAIGGYLPLQTVQRFDPVEGVPADKTHHVLGGQGNIWTEYMPTESQVEFMTYPRALALTDTLWSPLPRQSFEGFSARLKAHLPHLEQLGVNYRKPE